MKTENLTVMFTDIKGFTSRTSKQSRAEINKLLELHDALVRPIFSKFRGTVIKTIGDAFLVTFNSPTNAVLCGMEIQKVLNKHNEKAPEEDQLKIRIAINSGEVNIRGNDVFGEAVNIAARIEGIAEPGEIYFTEAVYLAMNKREIPSAEIGHRYLKGIPHEIKVYKVLKEGEPVKMRKGVPILLPAKLPLRKRRWVKIALWIVGILFVLSLLGGGGNDNKNPDINSNVVRDRSGEPISLSQVSEWNQQAETAIQDHNRIKARELISQLEKTELSTLPPYTLVLGSQLLELIEQDEDMIRILQYAVEKNPDNKEIWREIQGQAQKGLREFGENTELGKQSLNILEATEDHLG